MTYFFRSALLGLAIPIFALVAHAAKAQPSFKCIGQLTATEIAICKTTEIAKLDVRMAKIYRAKLRQNPQSNNRRLKREQKAWLAWRNTCGNVRACLIRRYNERITDLQPKASMLQVVIDPNAIDLSRLTVLDPNKPHVVDRRIRNGRIEVEYSDGSVHWEEPATGGSGIDSNGSTITTAKIQVEGDPVPPLPPEMSMWGVRVEEDLLRIIDQLLPQADRGPYRSMFAHQQFPERILSHMTVVDHLVGN